MWLGFFTMSDNISITPIIAKPDLILAHCKNQKYRFVLASADLIFLQEHIECLTSYEESECNIPYLVGVYKQRGSNDEISQKLNAIRKKHSLRKVLFFEFYSDALETEVLSKLSSSHASKLRINYIRNARFSLLTQLWKIFRSFKGDFKISQASSYVIDFDSYFSTDLNRLAKKLYPESSMILSWNSAIHTNKDFPKNLSGFGLDKTNNHEFIEPYKIIKAGFSIFSPSRLTRLFLKLMTLHTFGTTSSEIANRLFSYYYSDQLSLLLALHDIKASGFSNLLDDLNWLDLSESRLASLEQSISPSIWLPKGNPKID